MTAYYNEKEPYVAQWLRNLIAKGLIAPGDVDERSIEDVHPDDLNGYTQCHFFAGIGLWSLALRNAGWPDDREVWTGSCPCQPFSTAGKGDGFADERHLWPAWFHLITQRKPKRIYGEQVASKDGLGWFDLVQTDLEAAGYASGGADICAAGVGAPHIRQRLWFTAERLADSNQVGCEGIGWSSCAQGQRITQLRKASSVANTECKQCEKCLSRSGQGDCSERGGASEQSTGLCLPSGMGDTQSERCGEAGKCVERSAERCSGAISTCWMADASSERRQQNSGSSLRDEEKNGRQPDDNNKPSGDGEVFGERSAYPVNGFWADADWISCRDGRFRPVRPGSFPLVNGDSNRVGRLRAYGNAINPEVAQLFIEATM